MVSGAPHHAPAVRLGRSHKRRLEFTTFNLTANSILRLTCVAARVATPRTTSSVHQILDCSPSRDSAEPMDRGLNLRATPVRHWTSW